VIEDLAITNTDPTIPTTNPSVTTPAPAIPATNSTVTTPAPACIPNTYPMTSKPHVIDDLSITTTDPVIATTDPAITTIDCAITTTDLATTTADPTIEDIHTTYGFDIAKIDMPSFNANVNICT
jgi:hypothetical protein